MTDLEKRQGLGAEVERDMLAFLLQYAPAKHLTVSDVKIIAATARNYAFEALTALAAGERDARR